MSHCTIRTHVCNNGTCRRSFFNHADLLKHVRTHEMNPIHWDKCDYTTMDIRFLKSHIKLHVMTYHFFVRNANAVSPVTASYKSGIILERKRKAISLGNWVATHSGATSLSLISRSNINTQLANLCMHSKRHRFRFRFNMNAALDESKEVFKVFELATVLTIQSLKDKTLFNLLVIKYLESGCCIYNLSVLSTIMSLLYLRRRCDHDSLFFSFKYLIVLVGLADQHPVKLISLS